MIFSNIFLIKNKLNKKYEFFISRLKDRFNYRTHLIIDNDLNSSFFKEIMSAITFFSFYFCNFEVLPDELNHELTNKSNKSDKSAESN